jgi:hypothetical protein
MRKKMDGGPDNLTVPEGSGSAFNGKLSGTSSGSPVSRPVIFLGLAHPEAPDWRDPVPDDHGWAHKAMKPGYGGPAVNTGRKKTSYFISLDGGPDAPVAADLAAVAISGKLPGTSNGSPVSRPVIPLGLAHPEAVDWRAPAPEDYRRAQMVMTPDNRGPGVIAGRMKSSSYVSLDGGPGTPSVSDLAGAFISGKLPGTSNGSPVSRPVIYHALPAPAAPASNSRRVPGRVPEPGRGLSNVFRFAGRMLLPVAIAFPLLYGWDMLAQKITIRRSNPDTHDV